MGRPLSLSLTIAPGFCRSDSGQGSLGRPQYFGAREKPYGSLVKRADVTLRLCSTNAGCALPGCDPGKALSQPRYMYVCTYPRVCVYVCVYTQVSVRTYI